MRRRRKTSGCACGSGEAYMLCCGRFVAGDEVPDRAEVLMRSRYAAYAKGEVGYVIETTDPQGSAWENDETHWRKNIRDFHRSCTFHGVDVLESSEQGDRATVRFRARISRDSADASFTETSSFVRRDGRWLYNSAQIEPTE